MAELTDAAQRLRALQQEATAWMPGGVSASSRINPWVRYPLIAARAEGARIWDVTGKEYLDFFMGNGAKILGHHDPGVRSAIETVLDHGVYAEYDHLENARLARRLIDHIPSAELVRFQNSGSEATMLAIRLARGFTGRDVIVRFDGQFHGIHDYVMYNSIAAKIDRSNPGDRVSRTVRLVGGIPRAIEDTVIVVPWNNVEVLTRVMEEQGDRIAGIIINPIDFNNGCIVGPKGYLATIRRLADRAGSVLIFDEILTAFKTGLSCGQGYVGVTPDVCTVGKALSNGVPTAVVAGRAEIMQTITREERPVVASGTFSGNLFGTAAAHAALDRYEDPSFYPDLFRKTRSFVAELRDLARRHALPVLITSIGCMFGMYWGRGRVRNYADVNEIDRDLATRFFTRCIDAGMYFHTDFTISAAHTDSDLEIALERIDRIMATL